MKLRISGIVLFSLCLPLVTHARNSESFDKMGFMKKGLSSVSQSLEDRVGRDLPLDKSCPEGGLEIRENLRQATGGIFTAMDIVYNLMKAIKPAVQEQRVDQTRCGSCQQINAVSYYASINPVKVSPTPECNSRPGETFSMDLQDRKDIRSATEQILQAKNTEGRRLQAECPNPCAYYVTTAETSLPNGKTHLTLSVQCGPPRSQSIFSAVYEFKAGLIHQWTCAR